MMCVCVCVCAGRENRTNGFCAGWLIRSNTALSDTGLGHTLEPRKGERSSDSSWDACHQPCTRINEASKKTPPAPPRGALCFEPILWTRNPDLDTLLPSPNATGGCIHHAQTLS
uniref:Uncharacterized protein n=1 Tax=Sphaerodactylus townsendi TaxID=933632 RepID=A0ACB8FL90_9SAUR